MITLAATHHDPEGRLYEQTARMLPRLQALFGDMVLHLTSTTQPRAEELLRAAGADITRETDAPGGLAQLGRPRRAVIAQALARGAQHMIFCDFDRMLHWAEFHADELAAVIAQTAAHDFTVLGRTPRAYATHPRCQRDTEATINTVFASVSGHAWDVGAGARSLSRRAAEAILAGCDDQSVGVDCTWPLFLLRAGSFDLGYTATEGMEFETADRYADQIAACGSVAAWIAQLDADPQQWVLRLGLAQVEVAAMVGYSKELLTS